MTDVSRRALLTRTGIALGAGAVGAGAAGAASAQAVPGAQSLTWHATQLRVLGERSPAAIGAARAISGRVHEREGAEPTGELHATSVVLAASSMFDSGPALLETHLFTFSDATLTGTGLVHQDGAGEFTITGGTGRFAGARGAYSTTHSADHSGTGEGLFTLTIG